MSEPVRGTDERSPLLLSQSSTVDNINNAKSKASLSQTVLNLMKTCAGSGCLALPFACKVGGIVVFCIGSVAIAAWNVYCVERLCSCLRFIPNYNESNYNTITNDELEDNNNELTEKTEKGMEQTRTTPDSIHPPSGTSVLGQVAWYSFGKNGLIALDAMMIVLLFGIIVSYLCAIISFWGDTPLSMGPLMDGSSGALLMWILALVPDLGYLSNASAVGLSVLLTTFSVIALYGMTRSKAVIIHEQSDLTFWPESMVGLSQWFGVLVFGYGVVPLTYNFRSSMREPDRMVGATAIALTGVAAIYIVLGVGLYAMYPTLTGEILHELPASGFIPIATRIAMVCVVIMTAPLLVVPCGELIEGKWSLQEHVPVVRFGVCGLSVLIAVMMPNFVEVLSFVGCACVGLVGFCLPPLLHIRLIYLSGNLQPRTLITDALFLAWGVIATLISTLLTFGQISRS